jgi:two-component system, NtrC family, response regulator AtoC
MSGPRGVDAADAVAPEAATELDTLAPGPRGPGPATSAWLVLRDGAGSRVVELVAERELRIGRGRDADVVVDDARVSRLHARIYRTGDKLELHDLGSRNGTSHNGCVLRGAHVRLRAGDVVRIADTEAIVALAAGGTEPVDAPLAVTGDDENAFVVADSAMNALMDRARRVAASDTTVLILGETGVGKEVLARQIHASSSVASGPFVRVNLPSLPENLLESQLFGHERGAFTGADRARPGFFEAAHNGTLLLDEIGDLPAHLQVKLLSALENRCIIRVGGTRELAVRVRVVAATLRDLEGAVQAGRFRQDLYYRLASFTLRIPPLRERPTEIMLLAGLLARREAARLGRPVPDIAPAAARLLTAWSWPGNVRELRNAMEHALVLAAGGVILPEHLPASLQRGAGVPGGSSPAMASGVPAGPVAASVAERLEELERRSIVDALAAEQGNRTHAAQRLGMSRRALIYKLHKYGLG